MNGPAWKADRTSPLASPGFAGYDPTKLTSLRPVSAFPTDLPAPLAIARYKLAQRAPIPLEYRVTASRGSFPTGVGTPKMIRESSADTNIVSIQMAVQTTKSISAERKRRRPDASSHGGGVKGLFRGVFSSPSVVHAPSSYFLVSRKGCTSPTWKARWRSQLSKKSRIEPPLLSMAG